MPRACRRLRAGVNPTLESDERRAPGETAAEGFQQQELARLDAAVAHRDVERHGHRCCRGIAVVLHGLNDLIHRHAEALGRRLDNADVGLVRNEPVNGFFFDVVGFERDIHDALERLHRHLEHFVAGHLDRRLAFHDIVQMFGRTCFHLEQVAVAPVGTQVRRHDAGLVVGLEHDGTRTVAKQHTGVACLTQE